MEKKRVTFDTKCWEADWRIILNTDYLKRQIDNCNYDFAEKVLFINNVDISILSASHDKDSEDFMYIEKHVELGDNVWTGIGSIILPGTIMLHGSILAAGSVAIGKEYEEYGVYSGVPAVKIGTRKLSKDYDLSKWAPWFR